MIVAAAAKNRPTGSHIEARNEIIVVGGHVQDGNLITCQEGKGDGDHAQRHEKALWQ